MDYACAKSRFHVLWDPVAGGAYPVRALASVTSEEFLALRDTFPEDIYLFDDSFSWTVIFTHEYRDKPGSDKPRCHCLQIIR